MDWSMWFKELDFLQKSILFVMATAAAVAVALLVDVVGILINRLVIWIEVRGERRVARIQPCFLSKRDWTQQTFGVISPKACFGEQWVDSFCTLPAGHLGDHRFEAIRSQLLAPLWKRVLVAAAKPFLRLWKLLWKLHQDSW